MTADNSAAQVVSREWKLPSLRDLAGPVTSRSVKVMHLVRPLPAVEREPTCGCNGPYQQLGQGTAPALGLVIPRETLGWGTLRTGASRVLLTVTVTVTVTATVTVTVIATVTATVTVTRRIHELGVPPRQIAKTAGLWSDMGHGEPYPFVVIVTG
ncbi:uncharacterized protein B0I36DRAFT_345154 [Microdochium trichocladiopsis]|uniref:Uncharacterized protein n=1 Tax=Microdochium trichocladiopsis TaxID=1682393 RepID=A0A9P9BXF6_9PEZI|nr:uncharacterized protein B0I36DRAFT_345154 [Microdochium trichocladiopsis]KAH7041565.1 hypothetical protein B0I36DRAFT_345154 [Microdochium trichocladiopsis]